MHSLNRWILSEYRVCRLLFRDLRRDRAGLTWNAVINCGYMFGAITKDTGNEITFLRVPEPCPAGRLWSLSATWRLSISPSRENPSLTQWLNTTGWYWWNQWCWKWKGMRGSLGVVGMWTEPGTERFWKPPFSPAAVHDEIMICAASLVTGLVLTTSPRYFTSSSFLLRFLLIWWKGEISSFSQPILISVVEPSAPDQVRWNQQTESRNCSGWKRPLR